MTNEKLQEELLSQIIFGGGSGILCLQMARRAGVRQEMFSDRWRSVWNAVVSNEGGEIEANKVCQDAELRKRLIKAGADVPWGDSNQQIVGSFLRDYQRSEAADVQRQRLAMIEGGASLADVEAYGAERLERLRGIASNDDGGMWLDDARNELCEFLPTDTPDKRVHTGFETLDAMLLGGFGAADLAIVAARPSVGKTAVTLQLALESARQGKKTCYFCFETQRPRLMKRIVLNTGELGQGDFAFIKENSFWDKMERAGNVTDKLPLRLYSPSDKNLQELKSIIRNANARGDCDVAFIDYLGIIGRDNPTETEYEFVTRASRELRQLALSLNIPVVLICQVNRAAARNENGTKDSSPKLHELRSSGAIEQDACIVLMLSEVADYRNVLKLSIEKNRDGMKGEIFLGCDESHTRYWETQASAELQG